MGSRKMAAYGGDLAPITPETIIFSVLVWKLGGELDAIDVQAKDKGL